MQEAKATSIQLNVDDLTPENIKKFEQAQASFGKSLGKLMAISENYPNLKAMDGFLTFQAQYEGMENRISTQRLRFNDAVRDYNTYIRKFPRNIWANAFGFVKKDIYFQAEEAAATAPDITNM